MMGTDPSAFNVSHESSVVLWRDVVERSPLVLLEKMTIYTYIRQDLLGRTIMIRLLSLT